MLNVSLLEQWIMFRLKKDTCLCLEFRQFLKDATLKHFLHELYAAMLCTGHGE